MAYWEGDTLGMESNGFNGNARMSGQDNPTTDALHLTERKRAAATSATGIDFTIDDAKAYTRPWPRTCTPS